MWIFLIIPMVISFIYFFYGMNPLTAYNTVPHNLIFTEDSVKVIFPQKGEDTINSDREIKVNKEEFKGFKAGSDYVLLFLKSTDRAWLWLPLSGFNSLDDFKKVIEDERFKR